MLQPAKVPGMLGSRQNGDQHRTAKEGCGEQAGQGRGQGQDCPGTALRSRTHAQRMGSPSNGSQE